MWQDYEASYGRALQDQEFLAWRESGARQKAQNIARVCRGIEAASLIEIGCGTGAVLRRLQAMRFAREYCCADVSLSAVRYTLDSWPALARRAVVGQADALPFPDGAFSLAVLSHVIEHLDDPGSAVREAARIARFVVVEVPLEKVFGNFVRTRAHSRPYPSLAEAGHVQYWSARSIARFLRVDAGMEILDRHSDLLPEGPGAGGEPVRGRKALVKRALRSTLPAAIYSRLLTTHAVFLCRRSGSRP